MAAREIISYTLHWVFHDLWIRCHAADANVSVAAREIMLHILWAFHDLWIRCYATGANLSVAAREISYILYGHFMICG